MQNRDDLKQQLVWIEQEVERLSGELRNRRVYLDLMRRLLKRGAEHIEDDADMERLITSLISLRTLRDQLTDAYGGKSG